jgi:hypothetical protein
MTPRDEGFEEGVQAQTFHVLTTVRVEHMLSYLESVGEHFNEVPFDEGFKFKKAIEELRRNTPDNIVSYCEVEQA